MVNSLIVKDGEIQKSSIDFPVHWYRRVFHVFGASFLIYYLLPNVEWINLLKIFIVIVIVCFAIILEVLRISGKISSNYFLGLRMYEKNRVGSYLFFGIGSLTLLLFFPQQIAVPCILCASISDPVMGEIRYRFSKRKAVVFGFLLCPFFFIFTWYTVDLYLLILVSIVGASAAILGESSKFLWLDDDFLIQILPAVSLYVIWLCIPLLGLNYPNLIINPW